MKKELKDYLHYHIGCHGISVSNPKLDLTITPTFYADLMLLKYDQINDLKLVLRPFDDMTEEEYSDFQNISFSEDTKRWEYDEKAKMSIGEPTEFNRFAFLLSKHFDLFGLIEAGLAIDKTKIQQ
jgi:hypothetical protein